MWYWVRVCGYAHDDTYTHLNSRSSLDQIFSSFSRSNVTQSRHVKPNVVYSLFYANIWSNVIAIGYRPTWPTTWLTRAGVLNLFINRFIAVGAPLPAIVDGGGGCAIVGGGGGVSDMIACTPAVGRRSGVDYDCVRTPPPLTATATRAPRESVRWHTETEQQLHWGVKAGESKTATHTGTQLAVVWYWGRGWM